MAGALGVAMACGLGACTDSELREQCSDDRYQCVKLKTSMGSIVIRLDVEKAPISSENFLRYMDEGFYKGTIFHRVIDNFVVQGGGLLPDMSSKQTNPPIRNESQNGLANVRGSIAMARTSNPHSATSQFYINLRDNRNLDASPGQYGYAVFGKVIEGMETVDKIAKVATHSHSGHSDVPRKAILLKRAKRL